MHVCWLHTHSHSHNSTTSIFTTQSHTVIHTHGCVHSNTRVPPCTHSFSRFTHLNSATHSHTLRGTHLCLQSPSYADWYSGHTHPCSHSQTCPCSYTHSGARSQMRVPTSLCFHTLRCVFTCTLLCAHTHAHTHVQACAHFVSLSLFPSSRVAVPPLRDPTSLWAFCLLSLPPAAPLALLQSDFCPPPCPISCLLPAPRPHPGLSSLGLPPAPQSRPLLCGDSLEGHCSHRVCPSTVTYVCSWDPVCHRACLSAQHDLVQALGRACLCVSVPVHPACVRVPPPSTCVATHVPGCILCHWTLAAPGETGVLVSRGFPSQSSGPGGGLSLQTSMSACPTHV